MMKFTVFALLAVLSCGRVLNQDASGTFDFNFNIAGSGLGLQNNNTVVNSTLTPFPDVSQFSGGFISSAENFTQGGSGQNQATIGTSGASTSFGFDAAAANFGGVTNSTGAFLGRSAAAPLAGITTGTIGLEQFSTGTGVLNSLAGLNSNAGFSSNGVGVAASSTFLGGSDVGGLLPSQSIGAITGAFADTTGTAAGCSGSSSTSFLYGAGQTSSGCNVQSVIAPTP
eukprot:TRINITY_DN3206_c0_g1_i2.p1 TRINITY_DN3206_c0_g1~~TRINITY_DN3206_c0_g1_i2.p1  ORF type:complete len:262 (+),score=55.53 TRINITY_DN3206_c0_g1_i2:106-786(+)